MIKKEKMTEKTTKMKVKKRKRKRKRRRRRRRRRRKSRKRKIKKAIGRKCLHVSEVIPRRIATVIGAEGGYIKCAIYMQ